MGRTILPLLSSSTTSSGFAPTALVRLPFKVENSTVPIGYFTITVVVGIMRRQVPLTFES
jgi:hypothetical protein